MVGCGQRCAPVPGTPGPRPCRARAVPGPAQPPGIPRTPHGPGVFFPAPRSWSRLDPAAAQWL